METRKTRTLSCACSRVARTELGVRAGPMVLPMLDFFLSKELLCSIGVCRSKMHFGTRAQMLSLSCTSISIKIWFHASLQTILTTVNSEPSPTAVQLLNEHSDVSPSRNSWKDFRCPLKGPGKKMLVKSHGKAGSFTG